MLFRSLDPTDKSVRLANYILTLRKEILRLCHACGVAHPGLISSKNLEILNDHFGSQTIEDVFAYQPDWAMPSRADQLEIQALMEKSVQA